jgi:hypothetical protein
VAHLTPDPLASAIEELRLTIRRAIFLRLALETETPIQVVQIQLDNLLAHAESAKRLLDGRFGQISLPVVLNEEEEKQLAEYVKIMQPKDFLTENGET